MKCLYNVYIHKENEFPSDSLSIINRDEKVLNYQGKTVSADLRNLANSDLPYVITREGIFGIGVNKFISANSIYIVSMYL